MVEKEAEFPFFVGQIFQDDFLAIDIFSVIHEIMAVKTHTQIFIHCCDLCDQHFVDISKVEIPISFDPIELAIDPDTKPKLMPIGMIFISNKGIVNVPQTIILVKGNQQSSVSYRNVTGHLGSTSSKIIEKGSRIQQVINKHLKKHKPFENPLSGGSFLCSSILGRIW